MLSPILKRYFCENSSASVNIVSPVIPKVLILLIRVRNSLKVFILALKIPFKQKSFGSEKVLIVLLKFPVIWVPL